ncbi:MAG: TRAP transporter substrate-binding protein DctP [Planctomycetes bacterium]|nr:TRAP transporter substrate-binding protein DctP [Planctomycetota bacterium]
MRRPDDLRRPATAAALLLGAAFLAWGGTAALRRAEAQETVEFKTATLAPEGSTWMNVLTEMDQEVRAKTGGAAGFKFYPGGVTGDEKLVVKKLRIGQVQAAGLTNIGLAEIVPETRVLDIPYFYRSTEEADLVRAALAPRFEAALEKAGYACLGWSDAGGIYIFSTHPVRTLKSMRDRKVWVWEGDQLAECTYRNIGVTPIPLALPDVLTSLQTGMIDTVYISPIGAIALQWFTKVHYMTDWPIIDAVSALIVQKKALDRLAPGAQQTVRAICAAYCKKQLDAVRKENADSLRVLKEKGIELLPPDESARAEFEEIAQKVSREMAGTLYPPELLDEVKGILAQHRGAGSK